MKNNIAEIRQAQPNQAEEVLAIENMIKNYVQRIDEMQDEIKKNREMFDDSFNNNPTYREASEKAKEVTKAKTKVRAEIMKQPSVADLGRKLKDLRFDVGEMKKTLSDYLLTYKIKTQATQLNFFDNGITYEIVENATVRRAK